MQHTFVWGGYFNTQNEMIVVNIADVLKRAQIHLQTDGHTDGKLDRRMDKVKPRTGSDTNHVQLDISK